MTKFTPMGLQEAVGCFILLLVLQILVVYVRIKYFVHEQMAIRNLPLDSSKVNKSLRDLCRSLR